MSSQNIQTVKIMKLKSWVNFDKLNWSNLSENPAAIDLLTQNSDKIDWERFCSNPAAIDILKQNFDKIDWIYLSLNLAAIHLLEQNENKICWDFIINNPAAIRLIIKNIEKIDDLRPLSKNPTAIKFLTNNPETIDWFWLSLNPAAIYLLEQNLDKINWSRLSENPAAIHLLLKNPEKINWNALSKNPAAIDMLIKNPEKINWYQFSLNPAIFEEYEYIVKCCNGLNIENNELVNCSLMSENKYCDNHIHKYKFEKPEECSICMESISEQTEIPLECGHWFHKECIIPTNLHICPMCRQQMNKEEVEYIFGESHVQQNIYNDGQSIFWNPEEEEEEEEDEDNSDYEEEDDEVVLERIFDNFEVEGNFDTNDMFDGFEELVENGFDEQIVSEIESNYIENRFIERNLFISAVPECLKESFLSNLKRIINNELFFEFNTTEEESIQIIDKIMVRIQSNRKYFNLFAFCNNFTEQYILGIIDRVLNCRVKTIFQQVVRDLYNELK